MWWLRTTDYIWNLIDYVISYNKSKDRFNDESIIRCILSRDKEGFIRTTIRHRRGDILLVVGRVVSTCMCIAIIAFLTHLGSLLSTLPLFSRSLLRIFFVREECPDCWGSLRCLTRFCLPRFSDACLPLLAILSSLCNASAVLSVFTTTREWARCSSHVFSWGDRWLGVRVVEVEVIFVMVIFLRNCWLLSCSWDCSCLLRWLRLHCWQLIWHFGQLLSFFFVEVFVAAGDVEVNFGVLGLFFVCWRWLLVYWHWSCCPKLLYFIFILLIDFW